ncbi:MAG: cation-translocating P-type ATPase, partial [Spirochaetales bacterium]|nr:cation-translocating P-type ATPase [Spirochaetales bacterium]
MTCASCSSAVERTLNKLDGVGLAQVNLATETATISFDETSLDLDRIKAAVKRIGYAVSDAVDPEAREEEKRRELRDLGKRLIFNSILTVGLMILSMGPMVGLYLPIGYLSNGMLQFLLATGTIIGGSAFLTKGFSLLFRREPNMDSLVAIGTTASYLYSIWGLVMIFTGDISALHNHLYFEGVGTILTLVMLGRY